MHYLTMDLYKDFKCVADACPNTCCAGWRVDVDKGTYARMIEKEDQLGIPAKEWIVDNGKMIYVKLDKERCPMLTEDNLCKVVLKLGPEYLCAVCSNYPRVRNVYGGIAEKHMYMSCPEIVRKLMERDTIEFEAGEDQLPEREYSHVQLYLFENNVRAAVMGILQSMPSISLNVRLYTAFTVLEEGIRMHQDNQIDTELFEKQVCLYAHEGILRALEPKLAGIVNENSRRQFLGQILRVTKSRPKSERFLELVQQATEYFKETETEQYLSDMEAFKKVCLREYSNFYTNYWVYRIFSDTLSVPDYEKSKEKFVYIAVEFALFQAIALASFARTGRLEREEYVYIISSISRMLEHSTDFRKNLMELIEKNSLITAAGILLMTVV